MTSSINATPFHAFTLAILLGGVAGLLSLNSFRPVSHFVQSFHLPSAAVTESPSVVAQIETRPADPEAQSLPEPAEKPAPVIQETTAQKRARVAPHIAVASRVAQISPALIEAIITAESAYNPMAISRTGAVGLMQLMPDTAERFGVTDRWDPAQNILGGARYLRVLLGKFNNNLKLAIAAYNAGEGAVEKHRNRIPPFAETQKYVPKVLAYYKRYRAEP